MRVSIRVSLSCSSCVTALSGSLACHNPSIVAVLVEVVQGEGGLHMASAEYLRGLRALCSEQNWLLMCDEVQCGMGRTGTWFGYQHAGIQPDVATLAKGLAGGVPVGACLASGKAAGLFGPGNHGTTFGGNALACAVCLAVLDCYRSMDIEEHVTSVGAYARERLAEIPGVEDVRGIGLMIGLTLSDSSAQECAEELLANGIVVNAIGSSYIRILPPLICEYAHIDTLVAAINAIIEKKK